MNVPAARILVIALLLAPTTGCSDILPFLAGVVKDGPNKTGTLPGTPNALPTPSNLSFVKVPYPLGGAKDWHASSFERVYAVWGNQLAYTTDAGRTWQTKTFGTLNLGQVFFLNESTGWVADFNGAVAYTRDGGATWKQSSIGRDVSGALAFVNEDQGFVRTYNGVFTTTDGGQSWSGQAAIESHPGAYPFLLTAGGQLWFGGSSGVWHWRAGAFAPVTGANNFCAIAGGRLYTFGGGNGNFAESKPGVARFSGTSFEKLTDPLPGMWVNGIAEAGTVLRAYGVDNSGSYAVDSYDDGRTWSNPVPLTRLFPDEGRSFPEQMLFFGLDKGWGYESGNLYRCGL